MGPQLPLTITLSFLIVIVLVTTGYLCKWVPGERSRAHTGSHVYHTRYLPQSFPWAVSHLHKLRHCSGEMLLTCDPMQC